MQQQTGRQVYLLIDMWECVGGYVKRMLVKLNIWFLFFSEHWNTAGLTDVELISKHTADNRDNNGCVCSFRKKGLSLGPQPDFTHLEWMLLPLRFRLTVMMFNQSSEQQSTDFLA